MSTILLVDDDLDYLTIFARLLSARYRVLTAADARAALELLSVESPDLVLMDVTMPGLEGAALLRAARRAAPDVPVAVVSGAGDLDQLDRTLRGGALGCLLKPFSVDELHRFIEDRLDPSEPGGRSLS